MVWTGGGPVEKEQDKKAGVFLRSVWDASFMRFCGAGRDGRTFR